MKFKRFRLIFASFFIAFLLVSCNDKLSYFTRKENVEEGSHNFYDNNLDGYKKNAEEKLRIGVLLPLSGSLKNVGESILNAIQMSLFDNNKKNIVLKVYNTEGTTFGAVNSINKAIRDGIDVVIGPLFSAETKAIRKILKDNELIAFSLSNDQELINTDNVFVTGSIPEQEIQTLISYMMENDFHNYIALMPNTTYGALMNKILRGTIVNKDGLLIKSEYYEQNDKTLMTKISDLTNFYEVPQTLYENYEKLKLEQKILGITEEPELIIKEEEKIYPQSLFIAEGGKMAEQIANLLFISQKDSRHIQLIGTSKLDGDENVLNDPYMNNVIFVGANPESYKKFSDRYLDAYKKSPLKISSMVYDLVDIMDKLYIKRDGKYVPDKQVILDPNGFDGIDGKYRFLPNGLVERKLYVLQLQNREKVVIDTNQEFLNY